jgi:hypothetical protein
MGVCNDSRQIEEVGESSRGKLTASEGSEAFGPVKKERSEEGSSLSTDLEKRGRLLQR